MEFNVSPHNSIPFHEIIRLIPEFR